MVTKYHNMLAEHLNGLSDKVLEAACDAGELNLQCISNSVEAIEMAWSLISTIYEVHPDDEILDKVEAVEAEIDQLASEIFNPKAYEYLTNTQFPGTKKTIAENLAMKFRENGATQNPETVALLGGLWNKLIPVGMGGRGQIAKLFPAKVNGKEKFIPTLQTWEELLQAKPEEREEIVRNARGGGSMESIPMVEMVRTVWSELSKASGYNRLQDEAADLGVFDESDKAFDFIQTFMNMSQNRLETLTGKSIIPEWEIWDYAQKLDSNHTVSFAQVIQVIIETLNAAGIDAQVENEDNITAIKVGERYIIFDFNGDASAHPQCFMAGANMAWILGPSLEERISETQVRYILHEAGHGVEHTCKAGPYGLRILRGQAVEVASNNFESLRYQLGFSKPDPVFELIHHARQAYLARLIHLTMIYQDAGESDYVQKAQEEARAQSIFGNDGIREFVVHFFFSLDYEMYVAGPMISANITPVELVKKFRKGIDMNHFALETLLDPSAITKFLDEIAPIEPINMSTDVIDEDFPEEED